MKHKKQEYQSIPLKQLDTRPYKSNESLLSINSKPRNYSNMQKNAIHHRIISNQATIDSHINFKPEILKMHRQVPGVGAYNIGSSLVKPTFETYQKKNHVVLVKINHIGGTSSFSGEEERFNERQSMYKESPTPGPGRYDTIDVVRSLKRKFSPSYSENYSIINQMIKQNRDKTESIPSYKLDSHRAEHKYNGIPRHLQEMYLTLEKEKEMIENERPRSLPLEYFLQVKKKRQYLPISSSKYPQTQVEQPKTSDESVILSKDKEQCFAKMTATMYKLNEQKSKQIQRNKKIRAILNDSKRRSFSIEHQGIKQQKNKQYTRHIYNKNMVNMLYDVHYNYSKKSNIK